MRTKKILSIVLTAIMVVGVFGLVGSSAATIEPQAAAAALQGWPTAVNLTNRADLSPRWDETTVEWTSFTGTIVNNVAQNNSFAQQRDATPSTARIEWEVRALDMPGQPVINIASNPAVGATQPINISRARTATTEQLVIRQGTSQYFGRLQITATVIARATADWPTGAEVRQTGTITIVLVDRSDFERAIERAERILENDNRYTDDFLRMLREVVRQARLTLALDITAPGNATIIAEVQQVLEDLIDRAPNYYRVWFIESAFLGGIVWGIADFFETIGEALDPAIRLFTAFFGLFGFFMPILSILLGLFLI